MAQRDKAAGILGGQRVGEMETTCEAAGVQGGQRGVKQGRDLVKIALLNSHVIVHTFFFHNC